jgi:hypothetical protein
MDKRFGPTISAALILLFLNVPATTEAAPGLSEPQRPEWSQPLNAPFVDIFRLLPDNQLLVGALDWDGNTIQFKQSDLKLLSTTNGSVIWSTKRSPLPGAVYSVVGVQSRNVIVQAATAKETKLVVYALADGTARWTASFKGSALSTLLPDSTTLVMSTIDQVSAYDSAGGRKLWSKNVQPRTKDENPRVVPAPDAVCIIAKSISCLDKGSGSERWSKDDGDASPVGRAVSLGQKLIMATDTNVTVWDVTKGTQLWRTPAVNQGLVDLTPSADGATLYAEWLDSTTQGVKIQALATADGKAKWLSDTVPIPRSSIAAVTGDGTSSDTGYFSSLTTLTGINLETGKVTARALLPAALVYSGRRPDDIVFTKDTVTVFNEFGAANFARRELQLQTVAAMQAGGTSSGAQLILQEERAAAAESANTNAKFTLPPSINLGQGSALEKAAQTRIQLAYAYVRPTLESSTASHTEKARAHAYVAQQIQGSISMQQQAIAMEKMEAAADLANSALGLLEAIEASRKRENQARLTFFSYFTLAGELRNAGTPPGYSIDGGGMRAEVFDYRKNSIATVYHSGESQTGWVHVAVLSEDGSHLIGAHVNHEFVHPHKTQINSSISRADLNVESYALDKAVWAAAEIPKPPDELAEQIRSGKLTSLQTSKGACYMAGFSPLSLRAREFVLAAIQGHNTAILEDIRLNGRSMLSFASGGFDAAALARDTLDPKVVETVDHAARQVQLNFELAKAVRLDRKADVTAAIEAGATPDGFSPLSETKICSLPVLTLAKSDGVRQLLLDKGAHINIVDAKGQTPLDLVIARKDRSAEKFLRSHGGKSAQELG